VTQRRRTVLACLGLAVLLPLLAGRAFVDDKGADANQPARLRAQPERAPVPLRGAGTVTILGRTLGRPIPAGFVGLSIEFPALEYYTGRDGQRVDPVFEQLVSNLAPGQSPVIRIGGDSTDSTWWPMAHRTAPGGVSFALTPRWVAVARGLARDLRARLILGVDLEAGDPVLAAVEARALVAGIGRRRILALEIGNEPTRYTMFPWYHTPAGRPVFARAMPYGFSDLSRDFAAVARVMPRGLSLAGPTLGGQGFMDQLGQFLATEPRVRIATVHRYPLNRCFTRPRSPRFPTVARLLSAADSRGLGGALGRYTPVAHRVGVGFRVDELNSVACGGKVGVSTTFASALWALDTLFAMARAGADGVNLHTFPGAAYQLFTLSRAQGGWRANVRPEYYGLLTFALAAPPGSRLEAVAVSRSRYLRAWATRTPDGAVRLVLINVDPAHGHTVLIGGSVAGAARIARLLAPSVYAGTGVSLAGTTIGPATGRLTLPALPTLTPTLGHYRLRLAAGSAALVTFARAR
jgi:hypothetical protein